MTGHVGSCRSFAGGDHQRGGESGFGHSDDQMGRGGHLGGAGDEPKLLVELAGVGVAGIGTGDDLGGRRSSAEGKLEARGVGEVRGVVG